MGKRGFCDGQNHSRKIINNRYGQKSYILSGVTHPRFAQGDLLYHPVHGLCRVDEIDKESQSGTEVLRYSLVPKVANKMKVRFVISGADMKASGFHSLISTKEANEILGFLEAGNIAAKAPENQAWDLAKSLLTFSRENMEVRDQRKRQALERSAKGLVRELAFVFNLPLKEAAAKVRRSLGSTPKINPTVLLALVNAGED